MSQQTNTSIRGGQKNDPYLLPRAGEGQESNGGSVHPETFPHYQAVHDYANAHGLEYAWEGTAAFEERLRTRSPEQFQIVSVHAREGMTRVILFSKGLNASVAP